MKSIEAFTANGKPKKREPDSRRPRQRLWPVLAAVLGMAAIGCSSNLPTTGNTEIKTNPSQLYFAPYMGSDSQATYTIDSTPLTSDGSPCTSATPIPSTPCYDGSFVRTTYSVLGATITDAGVIPAPSTAVALSSGVLGLDATYIYGSNVNYIFDPSGSTPPPSAGWVVELPGQAALIELDTTAQNVAGGNTTPAVNYFTPAVPTESCPSLTTAETFQFVTIPNALKVDATINPSRWNPDLETAYGSVKISSSGKSIEFSNVSQHILPGEGGGTSDAPLVPAPATATAACSGTYYGQVISVPATSTTMNGSASPTATIGIGPSGFLVEDAGAGTPDPVTGLQYENFLGAGYGAIGLPQPSSDLTPALVGSQYQGFLYSPGTSSNAFSLISSFGGYSNPQTSCSTLLGQLAAAQLQPSPNTVFGGEFAGNDPASGQMGNCDIAIDLGTQTSTANGLYAKSTVYVGAVFPANGTGAIYSFPAAVIAGQLQGKNAIFLIGSDTNGLPARAWGIYLLQSN